MTTETVGARLQTPILRISRRRVVLDAAFYGVRAGAALIAGIEVINLVVDSGNRTSIVRDDQSLRQLKGQEAIIDRNIASTTELLGITRQPQLITIKATELDLLKKDRNAIETDKAGRMEELKPALDMYDQKMWEEFKWGGIAAAVAVLPSRRFWKFVGSMFRDDL